MMRVVVVIWNVSVLGWGWRAYKFIWDPTRAAHDLVGDQNAALYLRFPSSWLPLQTRGVAE